MGAFNKLMARFEANIDKEIEMGFINSRSYITIDGEYAYTGMYDSDTDLVEIFYLTGPLKGKRKISYIDDCEPVENKAVVELLYDENTSSQSK